MTCPFGFPNHSLLKDVIPMMIPSLSTTLLATTIFTGTMVAQSIESYSPYWALNQINSNNVWPYSRSTPMRYFQIHDWDSFSRQGVNLINGIRHRTSLQFNYTNRAGRTVEIEMKMGLAATGITAATRSSTFDSNWDPKTIKTVIKKKKFTFPTSGATPEALKEFTIKFPFDTGSTFLYLTAQKRALVVETKQYSTATGGYAFDFWSATNTKGGGFSHRDGTYLGCQTTGGTVQHAVEGAKLFVGSPTCAFSGEGYGAKLPGLLLFGAGSVTGTLPGTNCQIKTLPVFALPFTTGATSQGIWSINLPVPNNANLVRNSFNTQAAYLDSSANKIGITTSSGRVNGFGTGNTTHGAVARIWYSGNPDGAAAATAQSSALNGLVTLFHN
jgi:hypothetical protein